MDTKIVIGAAVVAIIAAVFFLMPKEAPGPGTHDDFADCLTDAGFTMYGTDTCTFCKAQKEDLGNSFQYIDYVNCDFQRSECDALGVKGYPTWTFDGQSLRGKQDLVYLSTLSGCKLP